MISANSSFVNGADYRRYSLQNALRRLHMRYLCGGSQTRRGERTRSMHSLSAGRDILGASTEISLGSMFFREVRSFNETDQRSAAPLRRS